MTATAPLLDDTGLRLLEIQLAAKRTEQAALRSLGESLAGPGQLVPYFVRVHAAAKNAEWLVHREIRRSCSRSRVVIPFIPRTK